MNQSGQAFVGVGSCVVPRNPVKEAPHRLLKQKTFWLSGECLARPFLLRKPTNLLQLRIKLDGVMPSVLGVAADLPTQARCLTGRNACPPEAVGGLPGYEELRRATADPEHEIQGDGRAVPSGI